jgi:hypothetical protein
VQFDGSDGTAALAICESLLLALIDLKVISQQVAHDLLTDVVTTHADAAALSPTPEPHQAVVQSVQRIQLGMGASKLEE